MDISIADTMPFPMTPEEMHVLLELESQTGVNSEDKLEETWARIRPEER